jgi:pimeloyl-ACP methyl ester carboxylesterase
VPFADRSPIAPTAGMRAMFGDNFFYILYFQQPGVAEHELQNDVRRSLRRLLFGGSGNAPDRGINGMVLAPPPKTAYFLDQLADTDVLPPWLTEADLDYFTAEFTRAGFRGGLNWYRNIDRSWALSAPFQGKKIEQPALFISGDRDLIRMNPGFEAQMRAVVPNLRDVVMLPGIGHWTQQESPEAVNKALIAFLKSLK